LETIESFESNEPIKCEFVGVVVDYNIVIDYNNTDDNDNDIDEINVNNCQNDNINNSRRNKS
jgi:hypothetical protein